MLSDNAIRDFLMSRRDRLHPEDVGLPRGTRRRVAGLRREEVATLAGVSLDYYVEIERGRVASVSESVLDAIARALRLDDAERAHLFDLVRRNTDPVPDEGLPQMPAQVQQLLDAMLEVPAIMQDGSLDIVAANPMGRALYRRVFQTQQRPNLARYVYLDADSRRFFDDWDAMAGEVAAILRVETGRAAGRAVAELVADLDARSETFARRWRAHDVVDHRRGRKILHHAEVGELRLQYEALQVSGMPYARLFVYLPDPTHPLTRQRLQTLAARQPFAGPSRPG